MSDATSSEAGYLKCSCVHCGNHIEFPASGSGMTIDCPHCGRETELFDPATRESAVRLVARSPTKVEARAEPQGGASTAPVMLGAAEPGKRRRPISIAATPMIGNYQLPPLDFLRHPDPDIRPAETRDKLLAKARLIQQVLAQFEIPVVLGDITKGPGITRYELHVAPGVRLEAVAEHSKYLGGALGSEELRILTPVPGKSTVGVEVPNAVRTPVIIRDLLESEEWRSTRARIPLALGKDVYGHPIIADLAEMPNLLIGGSTGSGKSVCLHSIISGLLYRFSPDQLRFVMIDPRLAELQPYNLLPHMVVPVVNDPQKAVLALRWVVNEMEKRYQIFARVGVRNNQWCLFGFDVDRKAMRTFVLARLSKPALTGKRFTVSKKFDLNEYLRGSLGLFKGQDDFEVVVELDAFAADDVRGRRLHSSQELTEMPGGMLRVRLRLDSLEEAERWVLGMGGHVTVVRPEALRDRLAKVGGQLVERYG